MKRPKPESKRPKSVPSAGDIFREAMASENDRERRTLAAIGCVINEASRGGGPLVIVGAGVYADNIIDHRPCVHCGTSTDTVSIFRPPQGTFPVPPKTTVAIITTLCDNCISLYVRSDKISAAIAAEVMAIISR